MVKSCSFKSCKKNSRNSPHYMFVGFVKPSTDKARAEHWLSILDRDDWTTDNITKSTYICQDHFPENLFSYDWRVNEILEPLPVNSEVSEKEQKKLYFKKLVDNLDPDIIMDTVLAKIPLSEFLAKKTSGTFYNRHKNYADTA